MSAGPVRILGIDCGSRITGYGIIESEGNSQRAVTYGAIAVPPGNEIGERLRIVADALDEVLGRFRPDEAAVEDVFVSKSVGSAFVLAHVRGAAMLCVSRAGLPIASYTAAQVKKSVTGHGRADKGQIRHMVRSLLGVREEISPLDVSDALAVAYCHASLRAAPQGRN